MRTFVGFALLGLSAVFLLFELVALVDPVGTKMADDTDPFGPPPPWYVHAAWFGVIAVIGTFGVKLLRRKAPRGDGERGVAHRSAVPQD